MIVGSNALLNQYVPTFFIKDLRDGQTLKYDSVRKAFINAEGSGSGGVDRLGELLDVSDSVDNPLSLQDGQALVYNSFTSLWENTFVDYNTLINLPTLTNGTVTNVSGTGTQGVTVLITDPTTAPNITIGLGDITPTSIISTGTISGSNLSGTNTGDQTIVLSGDATGTGTGPITLTLATVNLSPGTFGDAHFVPTITVNEKGLVTSVTTQHIDTSVRDLVDDDEVIVVAARHQYIVTSELEINGYIENNGVIAIL